MNNELNELRKRASALIAGAEDIEAMKNAANLFKTIAEIDANQASTKKLHVESKKLDYERVIGDNRTGSEERRYYASLVAPIISTIVLAVTLVFQFYQARVSDNVRREEATQQTELREEQRWKDSLSLIDPNNVYSIGLLQDFIKSPKYRQRALVIAWDYAERTDTLFIFKELVGSILAPHTWETISQLFAVQKKIAARWFDNKNNPAGSNYYEMGISNGNQIALLLRDKRPSNVSLSLSGISFWDIDLSGADLHSADLSNTGLTRINLTGADLSGVTYFQGMKALGTAWWRVKLISPNLLDFLVGDAPFNANTQYSGPQPTKDEYDSAVGALRKLTTKPVN